MCGEETGVNAENRVLGHDSPHNGIRDPYTGKYKTQKQLSLIVTKFVSILD